MLELLGSGYVIEYCVAAYTEHSKQEAYRNYIADGVRNINEAVATYYGGTYMQIRFADMMRGEDAGDERTGDEVALEVIEKAGLIANGFNDAGSEADA